MKQTRQWAILDWVMQDANEVVGPVGNDQIRELLHTVLGEYPGRPESLVVGLLHLQAEIGWIPREAVVAASERFGVSHAEVWGVLTFYADFRLGEQPSHSVDVCIDAPCHLVGSDGIYKALEGYLAKGSHGEDTALRRVSCPRLCAKAPVVCVDRTWFAEMTADLAVRKAMTLQS